MKSNPIYLLLVCVMLSCGKKSKPADPAVTEPISDFVWAGKQTAPAQIVFNNQAKNAATYRWDFGNGTSSTLQFPTAVNYDQPGSYNVVLVAQNGTKQHLITKTLVIAANDDPISHFSYRFKDQRSYAPATILFTNESVNATAYEWRINGQLYTEKEPQATFTQAGTYKVKLVALKNGIQSATFEQDIIVGANPDPIAKFALNYHPFPYHVGEEIQFVNLSENSDAWTWTFGANGPAASSEQHPLVKFDKAGVHTITLTAKKGNLSSTPRSINLLINQ